MARSSLAEVDEVDMQRLSYILDRYLSLVDEFNLKLVANMVPRGRRACDPAWPGKTLESGGNVHAVAIDVIAFDDHITNMETDTQFDMAVFRDSFIAIRHSGLYFHGTAGGIDHAA